MYDNQVYVLLLVLVYISCMTESTHFRGSMISWRIISESPPLVTIEILQRHAWRYTFYSPFCTLATIQAGQPILGSSGYSIDCVSNCPAGLTVLGSVGVPCTGFNIAEQYAMGEGRFTLDIPQNSSFEAAFSNSAWFNLVTGNNLPWSVAVLIQTFKRSDNNRYNQAPIVTMLPIYRLRNLMSYSLKINVADNDYDPYICLWSDGSTQCGGLTNNVPGAIVDNFGCYLNFTPNTVGFYAAALTVEDFIILPINISSGDYLSQVPIQFVFHVYDSPDPCYTGPVYIGDLVPDICIYMPIGETRATRVRFKVQCPNATVDSVISVNPAGLLTSPVLQDPFDPTIFAFLANFTASAQQVGQNLFCFAAVDSIGNQGDSACLRFAVASETSSLQPLYLLNATRYPMGTVSKTTSLWTMMTTPYVYTRPNTEAYIRFKRASDDTDFYVLNVVTDVKHVIYLNDRLVINTTVTWGTDMSFYIYFEGGVFIEASTCSKHSMPISDPKFWPFDIPFETTVTTTTTTTTTSISSTTTARTTPTRRSLGTTTTTTSTSTSTTTTRSTSITKTSTRTIGSISSLSISAIVGISLGCLLICALITWIIFSCIRIALIRFLLLESGLREQFFSIPSTRTITNTTSNEFYNLSKHNPNSSMSASRQYKIATRFHRRQSRNKYAMLADINEMRENLVEVQV